MHKTLTHLVHATHDVIEHSLLVLVTRHESLRNRGDTLYCIHKCGFNRHVLLGFTLHTALASGHDVCIACLDLMDAS